MTEILFYEWDYDQDVIIQYQRVGECNGCGDCCRAAIEFIYSTRQNGELAAPGVGAFGGKSGGDTTDGKGVWHEVRRGGVRRFWKMKYIGKPGESHCEMLDEDNRCMIQSTKGLFNKVWPMSPRHVTPFERCSYFFVEIARWSIEHVQSQG